MAGMTTLRSFALHTVLFAAFGVPWLARAVDGVPASSFLPDAQLVVWALAWVAHALAGQPSRIFDANINFPAPAQLTGSDHFLASQILFAPVFWLTGNPIFAANVIVFLSYPLAACAMESLLRQLGVWRPAAWITGVLFALGPYRVPANLQLLQYPNAILPIVALALVRMREEPGPWAATLLVASLVTGMLCSYYVAVLVTFACIASTLAELPRPGPRRLRFVGCVAGAGILGATIAGLFLRPYLARAAVEPPDPLHLLHLPIWLMTREISSDFVLLGFALPALAMLRSGSPTAARVGAHGVAISVVGLLLLLAVPPGAAPVLAATPLRAFRAWTRFQVLVSFGLTLLIAAGLEVTRAKWGTRWGGLLVAALGLSVLGSRLVYLAHFDMYEPPALARNAAVYEAVGRLVPAGGALLELPLVRAGGPTGALPGPASVTLEPDAMLGSTRHWLPLVTGFTGYYPPQRSFLLQLIWRLPDHEALQELIDLTHVSWILLRPVSDWPTVTQGEAFREALRKSPAGVEHPRSANSS
jgi:hypothetical protein